MGGDCREIHKVDVVLSLEKWLHFDLGIDITVLAPVPLTVPRGHNISCVCELGGLLSSPGFLRIPGRLQYQEVSEEQVQFL